MNAPTPDFWWNGIRRYEERDGHHGPSFSPEENTNHDIPLYSGYNPMSQYAKTLAERDATIAELRFEVAGLKEAIEQAAIRNTQIAEEGAEFRSELGAADGTIRELREQLAARGRTQEMLAATLEITHDYLLNCVNSPGPAAMCRAAIDQAIAGGAANKSAVIRNFLITADAALAAPEAMPEPVAWMMPDGEIIQANKDTRGMWRIGGKPLYAEAVREALNEALQHCEFRKDAGQDSAVLSGMVLQIERCIKRALDLGKV